MRRDLISRRRSLPELLLAGFCCSIRIVCTRKVFLDTNDFIIITQRFHCDEALFIAPHGGSRRRHGAVAEGYWSVRLREFARSARWRISIFLNANRALGPLIPIPARRSSRRCTVLSGGHVQQLLKRQKKERKAHSERDNRRLIEREFSD